jgi:hypothetical protein
MTIVVTLPDGTLEVVIDAVGRITRYDVTRAVEQAVRGVRPNATDVSAWFQAAYRDGVFRLDNDNVNGYVVVDDGGSDRITFRITSGKVVNP